MLCPEHSSRWPTRMPGREAVPVVPGPAVLVHERREEQRRVGDPPGDHDVGALRERVDDRARAEVRRREQRRRRETSSNGVAGVEVRERLAVLGVQRGEPAEHVVADDGRDRDAGDARVARAVSIAAWAAAVGLMPPGVGDHLRAAVGDERQRPREVRGEVARVAARLVALAILLEDRQRQLGERFEAEVVDAFGEQRVDRGRRVAVEALPARDAYLSRHGWLRHGRAGRRSAHGRACSSCAATRSSRSSRPYAAISCDADRQAVVVPVQRQRDRGLARHVRERRVRHEGRGAHEPERAVRRAC